MGQIALKSGYMSCWSAGVALGILVLLLCDGPGCGLHLDLSDNGTPAGLARVRKTAGEIDTIFIHIGAKEFTIPCKSSEMDVVIGMNPTYNWSLENEGTHPLSGDASLTLHDFHTDDSGLYVCTVSYTTDGQLHTKTFYHTVVGYHIRAELHVLLLFQCNSCDEELTHGFLKTLREHLSEVVHHLHCELLLGAISCFPTMEKPLDEFNFQVELEVSPFGKGWDKFCSPKADALEFDCYNGAVLSNLQQAEEAITIFMENNKRFPLGEAPTSRTSFVNTFVNFLEGGTCLEGYGQTPELQARCPDCCTACPPGTYSVSAAGNCVPCPNGSYSLRYGATVCIQCYHNGSTLHPAARTAAECMSPEAAAGTSAVEGRRNRILFLKVMARPSRKKKSQSLLFRTPQKMTLPCCLLSLWRILTKMTLPCCLLPLWRMLKKMTLPCCLLLLWRILTKMTLPCFLLPLWRILTKKVSCFQLLPIQRKSQVGLFCRPFLS
ncbi:zona pellucida-binding protein 2-like isoform X3 [Podarcis muralis]